MKRLLLGVIAVSTVGLIAAQAATISLNNQSDKLSYAMGVETGKAFKKNAIQVNTQAFAAGMQAAISGGKFQMSQSDIQAVLAKFQHRSMVAMQKKMQAAGQKNQQMGAAFLAANKKKAGVKTTPSGLQYKILTPGTGAHPTKNSVVTVNYKGSLINGTVFDSSYKRGQPATFPVGNVIPGWQEAIPMMRVGGTWEIFIPAKLAYGPRGVPGSIGPNSTLIFKVHLISIKK